MVIESQRKAEKLKDNLLKTVYLSLNCDDIAGETNI